MGDLSKDLTKPYIMGSKTSTRWKGHKARKLIEDCCALRVGELIKALAARGSLRWHTADWQDGVRVEYQRTRLLVGNLSCWLLTVYHPFLQTLTLIPSPSPIRQWLARCPRCQRRYSVLYLLPSAPTGFFCRRCLGLAYASNRKRQAQPRYVAWFR